MRRAALALALVLTMPFPLGAAPAALQDTVSTAPLSRQAAELMRDWLAGQDPTARPVQPELEAWRDYIATTMNLEPARQEEALRELSETTDDPLLRGVILRTISENPLFQSRQAEFIRRYGFYANWFNRLVFSGWRAVQGNLQAGLQLGVDAIFSFFRPSAADALDRRAYALMREAETLRQSGAANQEALRELEQAVDRALAEADMERAQWALEAGRPEVAAFYARQASGLQPEWSGAAALARTAEAEAARLRREAVASAQVGYPDRAPPVDLTPPDHLRALLLGQPTTGTAALAAAAVAALPKPGQSQSTRMRPWARLIEEHAQAPPAERRWLEALRASAQHNPDVRLERAEDRRRGAVWRFIFVGPEHARERTYKAATWMTTALDAMENVGLFYVFEVIGRTGYALFARPVPAEEVADAQAAWLRLAQEPYGAEGQRIARELAEYYLDQQRFEQARELEQSAGAQPGRLRKLNRAEARWLLTQSQQLPDGPLREAAREEARRLAPELKPDKTPVRKAAAEPVEIESNWDRVSDLVGVAAPAHLPGNSDWFDRNPVNGEASGPVYFETRPTDADVTIRYPVRFGRRLRIHEATVRRAALPPQVSRWLEWTLAERSEAAETIEQLDRLPIPFEIEGGAGPSGIDLYPRLLPIESKPGELDLYR